MSNLKFDDDVEKILNEVENYEIDDNEEGDHESVDVDALLKEDLEEEEEEQPQPASLQDYGDPLNILEVPMPKKVEKPKVENILHPFEALEEKERDISAKLGGQQNLDSKFVVANFEKTMNKKFPNVTYEVLETISNHCFPSEYNNEPTEEENDYWGTPKCLAIIPEKYIAFGTSNAAAFVYTYETSDIKRFGTIKEQSFGAVTALDVSLREEGLVCGYESGHIVLWGIIRGDQIKVVVPAEKSPVLSIKFWRDTKTNVIACNAKGVVQLYTFTSSFFQWNVERKVLINQSDADKKSGGPPDPFAHLPNGFLSIQVLRRDLTRHHPLNKYTVVALASMKMVIIITLEPVVGSVYKYVRPTGLSDLTVPSISWGKGVLPGQDDNRHPVLAMSWGNDICLLQCQNVEEEEGKGIKFAGYYGSPTNEIYHIDWISESNLLVYDYTREFKILNVEKFNKENPNGRNDTFNYSNAIVSCQPLDPDISFQVYTIDKTDVNVIGARNQRPIIYYNNTIVANQAARRVFVLGYKKMYVGRHFEWKEHIQDFVQKEEWLPGFALFMSIYKGNNKTFAGLPIRPEERKEALMTYGAELVKEYITYIHDKHGPPELTTINKTWKTVVFTIIDFLVSTENFTFLLKDTKRIFENFGLQDLFMECLEIFILRNRIKSIPNEPFREIVKYYSEREKIDVLQYLIINIDLEDIDIEFAITLCMEYNLLTALFYLCSHKEGGEGADFLTPIARAMSIYQVSVERGEIENQEYGIKFLWFIHMLLHGKLFPQGTIPEDIWQEKVKDVIILLFDEMHLNLMMHIEPYVAFEILNAFFEPTLSAIIESYDQSSIHLISEIDKINSRIRDSNAGNTELRFVADQFSASIENRVQADMLALIYHCGKKKDKDGKSFRNLTYYAMAILAVKYGYNIPDTVMQECLSFILENERDVAKWDNARKKIEDEDGEEIDPLAVERNDLILGLMKKLEGKIEGDELKQIKKKMNQSEFLDVKAYLTALEGNYSACFRLYLDQPSTSLQKKVFPWLNNLISSVKTQPPTKLKQLKTAIFNEFCELVSIDNEKARQVILNLDPACETEAVATLKEFPRLQLNYLNSVLEYQHKDYQIPDNLLILHMRLLCQLYPKDVLEEINKHAYPLDECLKICQEYNIRNGVAFFLERAGKLMEALNITLELFQKSLDKKLRKIEETSLFHEEGLNRKFQNAKDICTKNTRVGDSDSEKLWFRVFDKIVEGYLAHIINNKFVQNAIQSNADNPKADCYRRFASTYSEYVSSIFASISQNVSVDSIATKLRDYQNLKLADLRQPLIIMLIGYYSDQMLVKETKNMVFQATVGKMKHLIYKRGQGIGTGGIDIDPDLVDKMVVFDCGHSFPRNYVQENQCPTCLVDEHVQVQTLVSDIGKLRHRKQDGSRDISTASISPVQGSPRETVPQRVEAVIEPTEVTHEIAPSRPAYDPKEKYLRKLAIVDDKMIDSSGHWEDFEDIPKDPFAV